METATFIHLACNAKAPTGTHVRAKKSSAPESRSMAPETNGMKLKQHVTLVSFSKCAKGAVTGVEMLNIPASSMPSANADMVMV